MNSRTCTILSKASAAGFTVALLMGCGGSAPDPRDSDREEARALAAQESQAGENGEGTISFHYSNKSTDANLTIDLGSTDLYMEMAGAPPKAPTPEEAAAEKREAPPRKAPKPQPQEEDAQAAEEEPPKTAMHKPPQPKAPKKEKEPEAKQELSLPEDEPENFEDVTQRVLTGIRKAQELFYQKRYPEALQSVKSSLDARPTAEGHALAGSIHYMMNQGGMARRQWMEALRLNPDMPAVVNMLEKTRTPGGRGSPSPRPIISRPAPRQAPAPLPEADSPPFPEVYNEPAGASMQGSAAPVAPAAHAAPAAPAHEPEAHPPAEEHAPAEQPAAAPAHEAHAPAPAAAPAPEAHAPAPAPAAAPAKAAPAPAKKIPGAHAPKEAANAKGAKEAKAK